MYKTKLKELCEKKRWELPIYTNQKNGPDHMARFTATVTVKGQVFETPEEFRSVKEAQNTAAGIAFEHFNVPSSPANVSVPPSASLPVLTPVVPTPEIKQEMWLTLSPQQCVPLPVPTPVVPKPEIKQETWLSLSPQQCAPLPVPTPVVPTPEMWSSLSPLPLFPLSPPPSSLPHPHSGLLQKINDANTKPASGEVLQKNCDDTPSSSVVNMIPKEKGYKGQGHYSVEVLQKNCADTPSSSVVNMIPIEKGYKGQGHYSVEVLQKNCADTPSSSVVNMIPIDKGYKVGLSVYKNQLQEYAQKEDLGLPKYTTEAQGPPHDRRFKSKVCVDGKSYETPEFFPTLKEAEQVAAKVACQALSVDVIQEDGVLYKNLLQEFAQKKGLLLPSYETGSSGMSHRLVFVSAVTIGTNTFQGVASKTKKQAEMNAAKVAYFDLTKGYAVTNSRMASTITECPAADCLSLNIQPTTTIKKCYETTNEEHDLNAKRAKVSLENMNMVPPYHLEQPSNEQTLENQPFQTWKTVVFPQDLNWPIPENATVMPYSDEKWVAFKDGPDKEETAA